jgi:putative DNA primase/helicase
MTRESNAKRQVDPEATPLDRALWLIDKLGGDPSTGRCCCPAHDDEDPSLDVSLDSFSPKGDPVFICPSAGCEQDAIIAALKAKSAWPIPGAVPSGSYAGMITRSRSPEECRRYASDIYKGVKRQSWERSLLQEYFQARGIDGVPVNALLTMPLRRGDRAPEKQMLSADPGIVFRVRDRDNKLKGIHVIWLNGDLTDKREAEPQRQSFGPIKGGYVQLGDLDPDQPVLIAEGIETALAVLQVTGLPCAYVGCGKNTADIDMPPHPQVIIAADNGAAGQNTATELARRLSGPNCVVQIATPTRPEGGKAGYDWNDSLMDGGDPATLCDAILDAPIFDLEQADRADNEVVLPSGAPLVAAEEYIKRQAPREEITLLRTYRARSTAGPGHIGASITTRRSPPSYTPSSTRRSPSTRMATSAPTIRRAVKWIMSSTLCGISCWSIKISRRRAGSTAGKVNRPAT